MSDDEVQYAKKKKVVHYGGLDELPVRNDSPAPPGEGNENIQVSKEYMSMAKDDQNLKRIHFAI